MFVEVYSGSRGEQKCREKSRVSLARDMARNAYGKVLPQWFVTVSKMQALSDKV